MHRQKLTAVTTGVVSTWGFVSRAVNSAGSAGSCYAPICKTLCFVIKCDVMHLKEVVVIV